MENTTIYIATHKLFSPPIDFIHKPIVAGAFYQNLPYLKDNTDQNISQKNPYYSELIVLYWIWKNDLSERIGLTHYHRYFKKEKLITETEIIHILKDYKVIVPPPLEFNCTVYKQYANSHFAIDLQLACQYILKRDSSYQKTIENILSQNKLYACNMFIASKKEIDNYLAFLFPILFELEKHIPYLSYSIYNQRVFGFLAERIFNLYISHQNLNVYEYPTFDTLSKKERIKKRIKILKDTKQDNKNPRKNMHLLF